MLEKVLRVKRIFKCICQIRNEIQFLQPMCCAGVNLRVPNLGFEERGQVGDIKQSR